MSKKKTCSVDFICISLFSRENVQKKKKTYSLGRISHSSSILPDSPDAGTEMPRGRMPDAGNWFRLARYLCWKAIMPDHGRADAKMPGWENPLWTAPGAEMPMPDSLERAELKPETQKQWCRKWRRRIEENQSSPTAESPIEQIWRRRNWGWMPRSRGGPLGRRFAGIAEKKSLYINTGWIDDWLSF